MSSDLHRPEVVAPERPAAPTPPAPLSLPLSSVAIVVVAYNAETTIASVLDRFPSELATQVGAVLVSDDGSSDATTPTAEAWARQHPDVNVVVVRQPRNLGYGGNQKFCYRWALQHGYEAAVMVHGDGQYAPELAGEMVQPLLDGSAHAVFGSRMLTPGAARAGGMPAYKWHGNRVLTRFQNRVTGLSLSEWHTGYRAYSRSALARLDLAAMSEGFDFDTEIILQLADLEVPIHEIAIPTFYGNEVCHVNGVRYAAEVVMDVLRHRMSRRYGKKANGRVTSSEHEVNLAAAEA